MKYLLYLVFGVCLLAAVCKSQSQAGSGSTVGAGTWSVAGAGGVGAVAGAVAGAGTGSIPGAGVYYGGCHIRCVHPQYNPVCACSYGYGCRTFYTPCYLFVWNICRRPIYTWRYRGICRSYRTVEEDTTADVFPA